MYILTKAPLSFYTFKDMLYAICKDQHCSDCPLDGKERMTISPTRCLYNQYLYARTKNEKEKIKKRILAAIKASSYKLKVTEE